jgi:hypothetical protein
MAKQPMTPAPDPDAAEVARLRVAHDVLDERPSPSVRAAVLRAAADSVRGAPVNETVRAPRQRPARPWFGWRPAAAAGASLAVGILAVGIATHVERDTPTESRSEMLPSPATATPSDNAAPAAPARADSPVPKSKAFAPARDQIDAARPAAAPEPLAREAKPAAAAPQPPEEAKRSVAPRPPPKEAKRSVAPEPFNQATKSDAAPEPPAEASAGARAPMTQAPALETNPREEIPRVAAPVAKALSRDQAGAPTSQASAERLRRPASPEDWLRRIIELRRSGRNAEADDELTRFRAAFPNVKIPGDALR